MFYFDTSLFQLTSKIKNFLKKTKSILYQKLPIILQSEITECGLCCLSMIFNFYGCKINLLTLRKKHDIPLTGMSVLDIINIAKEYNFDSRVYKLELHQLQTLHLPAILHWDLNHFVVLSKITASKAYIHDPNYGRLIISIEDLSSHFTGIVIELKPNDNFKPFVLYQKFSLKDIIPNKLRIKGTFIKILILSSVLQLFIALTPQYIQHVIDALNRNNITKYLIVLFLFFLGLKFIEIGIEISRNVITSHFGKILNENMGKNIFNHILKLPISYFSKRHTGDIISKFYSIDKIRLVMSQGFVESIIDGMMSLITVAIMFYYNSALGLVSVSFAFLYLLLRIFMLHKFKNANDKLIKLNAVQNTYFIESLKGMQSIKIFSKENQRFKRWSNQFDQFLATAFHTDNIQNLFFSMRNTLQGVELLLIILVGAIFMIHKNFSMGMLYAFIFYRQNFSNSIVSLIDKIFNYRILTLHADRLADIMLHETEDQQRKIKPIFHSLQKIKSMEARQISFGYLKGQNLLENVSFKINEYETVVFISPSGHGKTTLLKILMGLIKPNSGNVYINEIPLDCIDPKEYRLRIAAVMQDDNLFSGTLAQNIAFFDTTIDQESIINCANIAGIHEDIVKLPMQYNSLIGDMGTILSGGQKQRILLARALYNKPDVLFLDEATSHLDQEKELEVNTSLRTLPIMKIMIAHRRETIEMADRIIDLRKRATDLKENILL